MDTEIKKATKVKWNFINEVGMPPIELRYQDGDSQRRRGFLIRGEYSIEVACVHRDGSGFDSDTVDTPQAWAVIHGF